ncbi:hypothetical protein CLOM_g19446 [Closterium sp. NIES-68]|nr:hypothetical protein CLOM_g19446 [Closterium sp. NIES-68]GJP76115.1 hypothetical protein CLOP_g6492 [Closterium sp. NIES-67]
MGSEGDLPSASNPTSSQAPNPNESEVTATTAITAPTTFTPARLAGYPTGTSRNLVTSATFAGSAAEPFPKRAKLSCPYHDSAAATVVRGSAPIGSCSFCASAAASPGKSSEDHTTGAAASAAASCHATIGRFATLSMGRGAGDGATGAAGGEQAGRSYQPSDQDRRGSKGQIRTVEYVRLIEQALRSLGYDSIAAQLEAESGVALESKPVAQLRQAIMAGQWEESVAILSNLPGLDLSLLRHAEFLLLEQKFLELVEAGEVREALTTLRGRLGPTASDPKRLHQLAGWLLCAGPEDLKARSGWSGAGSESRGSVLKVVQALLPASVMVPERRLEQLLESTVEMGRERCHYHNVCDEALSLFTDHSCGREMVPTVTTQVLEQHEDEVWCVQFSHDGTRLATASKDHTAIVWQILDSFSHRRLHTLSGHSLPLSYVAWSPDDSLLLTAGNDPYVCLWDAATGQLLRTFNKHQDAISACAWFPCGRRFLSASAVNDRTVCVWGVEGGELASWSGVGRHLWEQEGADFPRINDLAISSDCSHVVSVCNEKEIRVHELPSGAPHVVKETKSITSLSMSVDGRWVLVNLSSGDIHLWSIQDICAAKPPDKPAFSYSGQVQGRFVIRSCFGGHDQRFIISGSEDAQVYMWHRDTGEVMEVLPGHSGTVNAVSWPATRPHMFATASDDRTVRIWGLSSVAAGGHGVSGGMARGAVIEEPRG